MTETTNQIFKRLLKEEKLTQSRAAAMMDYSIDSVRKWCRTPTAKGFLVMKEKLLILFVIKLKELHLKRKELLRESKNIKIKN